MVQSGLPIPYGILSDAEGKKPPVKSSVVMFIAMTQPQQRYMWQAFMLCAQMVWPFLPMNRN